VSPRKDPPPICPTTASSAHHHRLCAARMPSCLLTTQLSSPSPHLSSPHRTCMLYPHHPRAPLQELLLLREFVEHLQHNRTGASARDIDNHTAAWVVDDVSKLPEELRSCCVCLEDINAGAKVRTLPCLHTFHSECAEEWLKKKKVCPLCQFSIDGQEDESVGAGAPNNVTAGLTG